jgi:hypothetical protein
VWLLSHAVVAQPKFVRVHAATEQQIVDAMLAANSSGQPTIIKVAPGQYQFTHTFDSEFGPSALPPVTTIIVIEGRDATNTRFEPSSSGKRAFTVLSHASLVLRNLSMTRWNYLCDPEHGCGDSLAGSAAANFGGLLWIEHCLIFGNSSGHTEGQESTGGALVSKNGYFHIGDSEVTDNSSAIQGGGIAFTDGAASIERTLIARNNSREGIGDSPFFHGAGILVTGSWLRIHASTITGNYFGTGDSLDFPLTHGAGITAFGARVWIANSAIIENASGLGVDYSGFGGGIMNADGGSMVIRNSTLGANRVGTFGGAIYNTADLTLQNVTVAGNHVVGIGVAFSPGCDPFGPRPLHCLTGAGGIWNDAPGTVHVSGSLIATNTASNENGMHASDCDGGPSGGEGVLISEGHNALGTDHHCQLQPTRASDQINVDPQIGDLQENGEPGFAHYPLLAESPLIDAGGRVFRNCSPRDQLGHRRVDGDHDGQVECDIGAIEFGSKQHGHQQ